MYCYHCGKEIDERKLERRSSVEKYAGKVSESTRIEYICPRCGHLIHAGADAKDIKSLSAAAHAEIQRGRNYLASGMGSASIGTISLIISIIFFQLSHKPALHYALVTTCPEFYVFCVLLSVAVILLSFGISYIAVGLEKKRKYQLLLRDIQNETFCQ